MSQQYRGHSSPTLGPGTRDRGGGTPSRRREIYQESFQFYCIYLVSGKYTTVTRLCYAYCWCVALFASLLHTPWVTPTSTESNCSPLWSICSASLRHGMDQYYNIGGQHGKICVMFSQNICTNFPLCTLTNNDEEQDLTMAMEGVKWARCHQAASPMIPSAAAGCGGYIMPSIAMQWM